MTTRRIFISGVAAAAATAFTAGDPGAVAPAAAAGDPKGPSATALAIAKSLQKELPKAHLSDALVRKIAGDIDGYAPVAADFRAGKLQNGDEPDFTFVAGAVPAEQAL